MDNKLNAIVLSYDEIISINFYLADQVWMEVKAKQNDSLPANILVGTTFYIKVSQSFFNDKFKYMVSLFEEKFPEAKVEKKYQQCPCVGDSLAWKNFLVNQKYNKVLSSEYLNFLFVEPQMREIMEYDAISEFNKVRGKEFISFEAFQAVYQEAQRKEAQLHCTT